jgi:hypothetical protein
MNDVIGLVLAIKGLVARWSLALLAYWCSCFVFVRRPCRLVGYFSQSASRVNEPTFYARPSAHNSSFRFVSLIKLLDETF